jgi:hypothetical protein
MGNEAADLKLVKPQLELGKDSNEDYSGKILPRGFVVS